MDLDKGLQMAFSRTAGGAARTSAGEGAAGAGAVARRVPHLGQKPATWRALGPLGPPCARQAAARGEPRRPQQPARGNSRRVLGPAGPRACLCPPGTALLPPRLRCSLQANPSTLGSHRETEVRSDCVHTRDAWGSLRLPAGVSYLNGLRLTPLSQRQLLSPTEPRTLPGRGKR